MERRTVQVKGTEQVERERYRLRGNGTDGEGMVQVEGTVQVKG